MKILFFACCLMLTATFGFAQIGNNTLSQWENQEPVEWLTNNLLDPDGKVVEIVVMPVGTSGAKLLVKKLKLEAPDSLQLDGYLAGNLSSLLSPQFVEMGNPLTLALSYQWQGVGDDVLKARVEISPRSTDREGNPLAVCNCQLTNGETILKPTQGSQTVSWQVRFPGSANPNVVPDKCRLYVWKVQFWIENTSSHPHEGSEALIQSVSIK